MLLDCKALCSNCTVCNCTKTDLARFFFLVSLGVTEYPWEIVGMNLVIDLTKSSELHFNTSSFSCLAFDKVETLSFVSCTITADKVVTLFIVHCYRLHGVP